MARTRSLLIDPDARFFAALGDPTRLAIVRELAGADSVCACDFSTCCDVRQPTVSHHLRVLREAGVIESERRGTSIYYRLAPAAADRLRAFATEIEGRGQIIPASALSRRPATGTSASA
ncbi:MAG TPA: metalloregulator ArsR/SmtB family transcription factor [Candidatus Limnocylindrales bacterium]|nr:metalloregulator ArsR/SmtB family transcription factor [Candidatus Limnocylindrales bacterium]